MFPMYNIIIFKLMNRRLRHNSRNVERCFRQSEKQAVLEAITLEHTISCFAALAAFNTPASVGNENL